MTDAGTEAKSSKRRPPEAILIDLDLCKSCGICSELCPQDVFDVDELSQPVVARLDDCTTCGFCERHCPDFAIAIRRPEPVPTAKDATAEVAAGATTMTATTATELSTPATATAAAPPATATPAATSTTAGEKAD